MLFRPGGRLVWSARLSPIITASGKKKKSFIPLNQDYLYGHQMADNFKKGLKEFYPEAQVVGEDFHKLFNTDFAPYLTKIKASGAEVVFTGNWGVDADNLLKQARAMGLNVAFAHIYMNNPTNLTEVGVKGTDNMVLASPYAADAPLFKNAGMLNTISDERMPIRISKHLIITELIRTTGGTPYPRSLIGC